MIETQNHNIMKRFKIFTAFALLLFVGYSCNKGIDPITEVKPKPDAAEPSLQIVYPVQGKIVRSDQEIATIVIKLVAEDDVELKSVVLRLDGAELITYTQFKDYRRAMIEYTYTNLTDGEHSLSVSVTDLAGSTVEKTVNFKKVTMPVYNPLAGETLYLPFEETLLDGISGESLEMTGQTGFTEGKVGAAFAGATDSYISMPSTRLTTPEFSVAFWYQPNPVPERGGMIAISPTGDNRKVGFRLFREGNATEQKIGLNIGIGNDEVWINPFVVFAPEGQWIHVAISISTSSVVVFVNGEIVKDVPIANPIDWTGCPGMTIGSGAPNFTYWDHFSDLSLFDEMHFFSRPITAAEVLSLMGTK